MITNVYNHPDYSMTLDGNEFFCRGLLLLVPFSEECFNCIEDFEQSEIIPIFVPNNPHMKKEIYDFLNQYDLTSKLFVDLSTCIHSDDPYTTDYINHRYEVAVEFINQLPEHNRPKLCVMHNLMNVRDSNKKKPLYYTDFLFNRQVSLFVEQLDHIVNAEKHIYRNHWYPAIMDKNIYALDNIDIYCSQQHLENLILSGYRLHPLKLFVSPCGTRNGAIYRRYYAGYEKEVKHDTTQVRDFLRSELITRLQRYPGYIGDVAGSQQLLGQCMTDETLMSFIPGIMTGGCWPIHNAYYNATVLSIYVESVTINYNNEVVRTITEKTWDPLIKGHFILPFGYRGMIHDLKTNYGFEFPDWIDYSYDSIPSDLLRWQRYIASVEKLLSTPNKELFELKIRDKEILKRNRNLFFKTRFKDPISEALMMWAKDNINDPSNMNIARKLYFQGKKAQSNI